MPGPNPLRVVRSLIRARVKRAPQPTGTGVVDHAGLGTILGTLADGRTESTVGSATIGVDGSRHVGSRGMNHITTVEDDQISQPEKIIRIAALSRAMLEEARSAPCDAAGCEQLRRIYERTLSELGGVLPPLLRNELVFMSVTFDQPSPSPSEIRVAQAELVGWLEGLLDGITATAMTRHLSADNAGADDRPGQYL